VSTRRKSVAGGRQEVEARIAEIRRALAEEEETLKAMRTLEAKGYKVVSGERAAPVAYRKRVVRATPRLKSKRVSVRKGNGDLFAHARITWSNEMRRVLAGLTEGISYSDLLSEIAKGELGAHRSKGDKGFYQAIKRLTKSGEIVKSKGLIYPAKVAEEFKARGMELPARGVDRGGSRTIIRAILAKHPNGLSGPQIQEAAAQHPDAPPSIRAHKHYVYNILGQMKKAGEIAHEGNMYRMTKTGGTVHVMH